MNLFCSRVMLLIFSIFFFHFNANGQENCSDVTLESQAEVDAFNCDTIFGDLVIQGADIANIDNLSQLKLLGESLRILNTNIVNLDALKDLEIANNLGSSFLFFSNPLLENIDGFDEIEEVGELKIQKNGKLKNINGFKKIKKVNALFISENPELIALKSDFLESAINNFIINKNDKLINIEFPKFNRASRNLYIGGDKLETIDFSALELVGEDLHIDDTEQLRNFDFPVLGSVGELKIRRNAMLTSVSGFDSLKSVRLIEFFANPELKTIGGFNNVTKMDRVNNRLLIGGCITLESIVGFQKLKSAWDIVIYSNLELTNVSFPELELITRALRFENLAVIKVIGAPKLIEISSTFIIEDNEVLERIDFPLLESVGSLELTIQNNRNLEICCSLLNGLNNEETRRVVIRNNAPSCRDKDAIAEFCATNPPTPIDCPELNLNIGDDCDDGNAETDNDTVGDNCICAGTPSINLNDIDDDGDGFTENQGDCDDEDDAIYPNAMCNDNNTETENDRIQEDCSCRGDIIIDGGGTTGDDPICNIEDGLLAYYPFNGNANDESGNGHGTDVLSTVALTTDRFGNEGQAYEFNETGLIAVTEKKEDFRFNNSSITISTWATFASNDNDYDFILGIGSDRGPFTLQFGRVRSGFDGSVGFGFTNGGAGVFANSPLGGQELIDKGWVHMVGTVDEDAKKIKFYVDGIFQGEGTFATGLSFANVQPFNVYLGTISYSSFSDFNAHQGKLDDVRIYNRALSDAEIQALYECEKPNNPPLCNDIGDADGDGVCADLDCDDSPETGASCIENCQTFYRDADGDTFGSKVDSVRTCIAPMGYVENKMDCDDDNPNVNPSLSEVCGNSIDEDCSGIASVCTNEIFGFYTIRQGTDDLLFYSPSLDSLLHVADLGRVVGLGGIEYRNDTLFIASWNNEFLSYDLINKKLDTISQNASVRFGPSISFDENGNLYSVVEVPNLPAGSLGIYDFNNNQYNFIAGTTETNSILGAEFSDLNGSLYASDEFRQTIGVVDINTGLYAPLTGRLPFQNFSGMTEDDNGDLYLISYTSNQGIVKYDIDENTANLVYPLSGNFTGIEYGRLYTSIQNCDFTDGLAAYYPLNGNANDQSGNNINGTEQGGAIYGEDRFLNSGQSLNLNGSNGYVDFGDELDIGTNDFAISLWFNANDIRSSGFGSKILNKGLTVNGTPSNAGYGLRVIKEGQENILRFFGRSATEISGIETSTWYHVFAHRRDTSILLYLNGELVDEIKEDPVINSDTNIPLALGALHRGQFGVTSEFFDGSIDDFRFYLNRQFSDEEVKALFDCENDGVILPPPPPCTLTTQIFSSQAQIDSFQCCTTINGDLIINGDDITDLSNLSCIKTITGNVYIGDSLSIPSNDILETLNGLGGIMTIGGDLVICNNPMLQNLDGFSSLMEVGGNIQVKNCRVIEYIRFVSLTRVGGSCLYFNLPRLLYIGSFEFGIEGGSGLTFFGGGITYWNLPSLTWITGFGGLTDIFGDVYFINVPKIPSLVSLKTIIRLHGCLHLNGVTIIENFDGLESLQSIDGDIRIIGNDRISDLSQLGNLVNVTGSLIIRDNDNLVTLEGLRNLATVSDTLMITNNGMLETCCDILDLLQNGGVQGVTIISGNQPSCNSQADIELDCEDMPPPPPSCDFNNPLIDLPFLAEIIANPDPCYLEIRQGTYNGEPVFIIINQNICEVEPEVFLATEIDYLIYDCSGDLICTGGLVIEPIDCEDMSIEGTSIWTKPPTPGTDNDEDGYTVEEGDCDDNNPNIYPDAPEISCNGIDENCDGIDNVIEGSNCPEDKDGDTFTEEEGDCDDTNPNINPNATEILCNGIDENCNGMEDDVPEEGSCRVDNDEDGFTMEEGDCDDNNANINPDATEIQCNGIDENCNGMEDDVPVEGCDPNSTYCPEYMANIGEPCDDNNPDTFDEWLEEGCLCVGRSINPDVCDVEITHTDNSITVLNLNDAHNKFYLYDKTFSNLIDSTCSYWTGCEGDQTIDNLVPGIYGVQIQSFNEDWTIIVCDKVEYVEITSSTGVNACESINVREENGTLTIENLPTLNTIVDVYDPAFNSIHNCIGDCGTAQTIENLAVGDYLLRIKVYDVNWQPICEIEHRIKVTSTGIVIGTDIEPEILTTSSFTRQQLSVFPNPVTNQLQIGVGDFMDKETDVLIYNMLGKVVYEAHFEQLKVPTLRVDTKAFAEGMHIISLRQEGRAISKKFIRSAR